MKITYRTTTGKTVVEQFRNSPISDIFQNEIFKRKKQYIVITDTNIAKIYRNELKNLPKDFLVISVPAGEKSKKLSVIENLASKLLKHGVTRQDVIIAFGGGTVGDISGFLASVYMRGIEFIQVPTTLLAMCDAAIGGKNGVDLKEGKNLLGTIYQPSHVLIQPELLGTLPEKQLKNGLVEAIKYGIILSKPLFKFIEQNWEKVLKKDAASLNNLIEQSIKIKVKIVSKDSQENGIRKILNYGHTVGHAIEKSSGYMYEHGEAVSIGMCIENILGMNKKITQESAYRSLTRLLQKIGLPTSVPKSMTKKIIKALNVDKKRASEMITMYLPISIGTSKAHHISPNEIEHALI